MSTLPLRAPGLPGSENSNLAAPAAREDGERRRLDSHQLFGLSREIEITHGDAIYRLRRTSLGKLILTK